MKNIKEKTATQNEQQLKNYYEIVNQIISIIADNNLSVSEGREILRISSKKLGNQKVTPTFH